jgi:hypothetical protein
MDRRLRLQTAARALVLLGVLVLGGTLVFSSFYDDACECRFAGFGCA